MGVEIIVPVVLFLSIASVLMVYRKFNNDERLALIEKGVDAKIFESKNNAHHGLRLALLAIGAGLGLLVAGLIEDMFKEDDVAYFSMIFIFGGIGLLIAYWIERKQFNKDND